MEPTPHGSGSDEHGATSRPAGRQWEKTLDEQFDDAEGLGDDGLLVVAPSGVTPGDLDDLSAELAGTRQAEPAADVEARVRELIAATRRDAPPDHVAAPQDPAPRLVIALDSGSYDEFSPSNVTYLINDTVDAGIVQIIIRRGGIDIALTQLVKPVESIKSRYRDIAAGHEPAEANQLYDSIGHELHRDKPKLVSLCELVEKADLDIPLPQAGAVMCFLDAYPNFWPKLKPAIDGIKFKSTSADERGGGLFDDNCVIHISSLPCTPPGAFARLVVHEMGHALFQTILLNKRRIPVELNEDKVAKLLPADPSERSQRCQTLQSYWNEMSPEAQTYYRAWLTLREHDGRHLHGLDLWLDPCNHRLDPHQRREYQAREFSEFCAETFMLFAMGDLHTFVANIVLDDTVSVAVRTAWRNVWWVLGRVALPLLLD